MDLWERIAKSLELSPEDRTLLNLPPAPLPMEKKPEPMKKPPPLGTVYSKFLSLEENASKIEKCYDFSRLQSFCGTYYIDVDACSCFSKRDYAFQIADFLHFYYHSCACHDTIHSEWLKCKDIEAWKAFANTVSYKDIKGFAQHQTIAISDDFLKDEVFVIYSLWRKREICEKLG